MAINIKNERTVDAVKRLAESYGVSYTTAIEMAAETVLSQPRLSEQDRVLERASQILSEYRAHLDGAVPDEDALYTDDGLYA